MKKEVVVSIKTTILAAFVVLCVVLALTAGGCSRTTTRVEKPGTPSADTAVGARKTNDASSVRVSSERTEAAEPAAAAGLDGAVYVAWVEHRGKDADVWLARFDVALVEPGHVDAPVAGDGERVHPVYARLRVVVDLRGRRECAPAVARGRKVERRRVRRRVVARSPTDVDR